MAKADPRLALPEEQQRGAAGVSWRRSAEKRAQERGRAGVAGRKKVSSLPRISKKREKNWLDDVLDWPERDLRRLISDPKSAPRDFWKTWEKANEFAVGPELFKYVEDSTKPPDERRDIDPRWLAADLALLPVPLKGFPTLGTVGLRAALGARAAKRGATAAEFGRPLLERGGYAARTLRLGDKVQQLPRARSRVTRNVIERPADAASKALMSDRRAAAVARRVLPTASAEARVAKAAGREVGQEAVRTSAWANRYMRALPKPDSAEDIAHFWWAQLPKAQRNVEGLKLVRSTQADELAEITSGRALQEIKGRIAETQVALKSADDATRFDLLSDLGELKALASDLPNRVEDLSHSLARLDFVVAKPPKLNERVVDAVRALSDDRKRILLDADVLKPERAAAREGLVSGWLGLERTGEEAFLGHRLGRVRGSQPSLMPISVGTGRVRLPQGVSRENKLVLAKTGRIRQSTHVAAEDWQAVQVYRTALTARSDLAKMGAPFTGRVPDKHLLVNPKGRPVPVHWKTDMAAKLAEGGDDEAVRAAAEEIVQGFIAKPDDLDAMLKAAKEAGVQWDELRVVPEKVVKRYYGQFTPARAATVGGRAYDTAVDFTAASIVFARLGYIPKNVAQNLIMATPHQGPFMLVNVPRAAQAIADPQLRDLLRAEVGFSGPTRGLSKEFAAKLRGAPSRVAGTVGSVADDPMRISAFLHEAAAEGVIRKFSPFLDETDKLRLRDLLENPENRALLNDIRSRAVEAMADFSRLTPTQRKWSRRFLIIPGWLWAGSRYPFHFAATHPGRSAALAYLAAGAPGAENVGLPDVPPVTDALAEGLPFYLEGIETPWGVLRTTSISPVNTPWEIGGAVAQRPNENTLADYANPFAASVYNVAGRRAPYPGGTYQADFWTALQRNLERLAPNVTFARQMISPSGAGRYPGDASRLGRLSRELGVTPIEVRREGAEPSSDGQPSWRRSSSSSDRPSWRRP